jgi:hypothetical protein
MKPRAWSFCAGRVGRTGFVCPRCKGRERATIATRRLEQCKACRHQTSLTAGTVLQGTRKPLRLWFLAMFFLGRHKTGISALQLQKDLGLAGGARGPNSSASSPRRALLRRLRALRARSRPSGAGGY